MLIKIYILMFSLLKNSGKIQVKRLIMSSGFYWVSMRNIEDREEETFLFTLNIFIYTHTLVCTLWPSLVAQQ